ncbi:murein biosynthesis integral membrane protein MurJ [Rhodococcus sp. IEGM 1408]|uniref:murein biosynthesis integral membrane protein MurJ n=1 Tax=Rhodococcus sp. IEGM 1408 TaxID=3082220 RepID=UPI0029542CE1|nr:murein biosynthesis integral membrane protein MurJ [Rhodococcus sp. IEGM 1408]MDV8000088.1 murein biosynthesis integral membrane protein MurJ [Rhodococcus sp. IEGM 1408]
MNDEQGPAEPGQRRPDPGLRDRRRESGSSVLPRPVAPPPVADSFAPDSLPVDPLPIGPSPVPPAESSSTDLTSRGGGTGVTARDTSDASVMRSTGSMAVANLASRITGFMRMILILTVLGPAVASAFNTANTLPNMITELVLGSVLTAMFMPLLARAAQEDRDGGASFIRRLLTVTAVLALVATVVAVACAPLLTQLNLGDGEVNTDLATAFAFLLLPQIFFYGVFSVMLAVLNYNGIFRPGAWAPVWNNLVSIATLALFALVGSGIDPAAPVNLLSGPILLLGLGTTLGVIVQAAVLLPALRRAGVSLRPQWGLDPRIKQFGGNALAGVTYVAISQVGLVMTNRIGSAADEAAIAIYGTYWLLLQVPYGIIGVTLLTAINPRLADNGVAGRTDAVVRDISLGTRLSLFGLLPIIAFMTAFGPSIATGLFRYGNFDAQNADILGLTLSFGAFTLIPYAIVLLQQRVFYAREDYWTPTLVILAITVVRVVLSLIVPMVADERSHVVIGLALANGIGWVVGAVAGYVLLRKKLGSLRGRETAKSAVWTLGASAVGALVALAVDTVLPLHLLTDALGSIGFVVRVGLAAIIALVVTGAILSRSRLPELEAVTPVVRGLVGRLRR